MPVLIRICIVTLLFVTALPVAAAPASKPSDPLVPVLAGEFALQAGRLPAAADWYLQAAEAAPGDAGLAERAARIAMLAKDDARATQALQLWRQRAPESLAMRGTQAALALRRQDAATAKRVLQGLLRDPDPQGWQHALVALASGGRDPQLSARLLGELVEEGSIPDELTAWQEFGRLALRMDQPWLAESIVTQLVSRFPNEPRIALLHATQLEQAGKHDEARAILRGLEPKVADDIELRGALAYTYDASGDHAAAARVLAKGPQDTQNYTLRASVLAKLDDKAALENLYSELARNSSKPDPERRLLLGKMAEFLERPQQAVDWYRGVPGGSWRTEARLRTANALYMLDRKDEAYAEVRALQADASAEDDGRRDAYLLEAELRLRSSDDAGELEVYARGLAAFPDDGALLYARGLAWERRDRIDRAEADLRRVLVSDPENTAALNALGYTLADRTDRYQEALEMLDRARTASPDNPAIIDSYGWVLYRLGRNQEALIELRRAWLLMKDPEVAAHIGEVLWVQGDYDEARKYFDEARKLDPENRSLLRALEKTGA